MRSDDRLRGLILVGLMLLATAVAVILSEGPGGRTRQSLPDRFFGPSGLRMTVSRGGLGMTGSLPGFGITSLDAKTSERLSASALEWTRDYKVLSGTPKVVLVRDLTLRDLLSLGRCPGPDEDPANPKYALVVVHGNLDLSNWPGMAINHPNPADRRFHYIAYVADVSGSAPRVVEQQASRNGGSFRTILDNPNLPDDVAPGSPPGTRQVDTTMKPQDCPAFGNYGAPATPGQVQPTKAPPD